MDEEDYWTRHLKKNNQGDLTRIKQLYPLEKTITIDVSAIINNVVFDNTIERPAAQIEEIIPAAIKEAQLEEAGEYVVRFININKKVQIRDLRAGKDERKLRSIECLIKRVTPVLPKVTDAYFRCEAGHFTHVKSKYDKIDPPPKCTVSGCHYKNPKQAPDRDKTISHQFIYVQESLENLTGGVQPSSLRCEVLEDLCNQVASGDRVVLNGVYRTMPKYKGSILQAEKDVFFEVNSIERGIENEKMILTEEDEKTIQDLSKRPDLYDYLSSSIAPSIIGMKMLKRAIVLQLFGGKTRTLPDGTRRRAYINILAVTDPGMAKTVLLQYVASISPRGIYVSAVTSSKVGLIAPLIRDEMTGQYAIEPGPYMLASGGILCLDEAGELSKEDFKYLGECMDSGQCHISKAGINATVKTEAALLSASNPKDGTYDRYASLASQVKIPDAILSRYDIKILQEDVSSEEKDLHVAEFISTGYLPVEKGGPVIDFVEPALMRKYIHLGRAIEPATIPECNKIIDSYWVKIRKECEDASKTSADKDKDNPRMRITHRQLVSLHHLAEAHARMRLSPLVEAIDAQEAVDLFDMCFRNSNTDTQGRLNMAMSEHKVREDIPTVIIKTICRIGGDKKVASQMSTVTALVKEGHDEEKITRTIERMLTERGGRLMEPKRGLLQVM